MASVQVDRSELERFVTSLYAAAGLPAADAAACAAQTVDAELHEIRSHGCVRTRVFVERLRCGTVNPTPAVRTVVDLPGWALLDGDRGMSAVVGRRAMDTATAKAAANGIGAAGVRRVSHTGHVGYFAAMALERGMIGIVASSAAANMAPSGGVERLVGNNPIAFAIPSRQDIPIVFDMATSEAARGWILLAEKTGGRIPEGWALDADGAPTTDARRALAGTLLPMGGHKGLGLAFVLGLLTTALTGNAPESQQADWLRTDGEFLLSMLVVAIDPGRCLDGDYQAAVDATVLRLKASRLAPGAEAIRIPGEGRGSRARTSRIQGITLDGALADDLDRLAGELGVPTFAR
jgi:LDH2 family malate/lactate/ureidoglycolate dehydrogenase